MKIKEILTFAFLGTGVFLALSVLGYLVMVGFVGAIQWLVNFIFSMSFDYNVWILGLLAYIIWILLKR